MITPCPLARGYNACMMGNTHYATGICAGAYCAWGVRVALVPEAPVPSILVVVLAGCLTITWLAGRAAYWPDLDHSGSTASKKGGLVTGLLSRVVSRMSCDVYDATATAQDRVEGNFRDHRGLTHFAVTALLFGALAGILVWQVTASEPRVMWAVVTASVTGWACSEMYRWARILKVRGDAKKTARFLARFYPLFGILFGVGAWYGFPVPESLDPSTIGAVLGWGVGIAVSSGMLAHDLGDAATKTGVPLFWPLKIKGRRYFAVHIRPAHKLTKTSKKSPTERRVRIGSWGFAAVAMLGWLPGFYWAACLLVLDLLDRLDQLG